MFSNRTSAENPFNPHNALLAARFFLRLPFHLWNPVSPEQAAALLRTRLERREARFLDKLHTEVFGPRSAASPYLALFRRAGCEYGDVERLVARHGIEGALRALLRAGVYLSVDEFKGRKPIERGTFSLPSAPEQIRNPRTVPHIPVASGGSRSQGTSVVIDLRFVRGCASECLLYLEARGGLEWAKAVWEVPGAGARFRLAKYGAMATRPSAWFSQVDPKAKDLHPVYRLNTRAMRWSSLMAGRPLPRPVHAPLTDPRPVLDWLQGALREGRTPHLFTFPSSAVALCRAAKVEGRDIAGARFTIGGEPVTEARLATIRAVGAEAFPRYGTVECGPIGYGCLAPAHADEVHLLHDQHALILAGEEAAGWPGLRPDSVLITALDPYSPFTFINISMGDSACLTGEGHPPCGCPLEARGWRTRLHGIRSYEKLTGAGMTFFSEDVIRVLEEVLPARFGGAPTDYQICEQEKPDGGADTVLIVHPGVGPVDERLLIEGFLEALAEGSVANQVMGRMWREAQLLRVERRIPSTTRAGKIQHFHVARPFRTSDPPSTPPL
ncbi:MAG: hypothetical protein ACE141_03840 [Bryobacteraceae bacterium]